MNWEQRDKLGIIVLVVILVVGTIGAFVGPTIPVLVVGIPAVIIFYWVVWKSDKFDE